MTKPKATGQPFATPAMQALRNKLRPKPDLNSLKVWNGNEGPTLEQLVQAVPPKDGKFY